ncbi:MAG: acetyl-CoA C-acetyltransferase [Phycisphaerae bacterium]|nr:acetyl-CoA C-acetyltransferase [Phycisphaerae bacterium]
MNDVVLLSAVRSPMGKFLGGLSSLEAPALGGVVAAEAIRRAGVAPGLVEEVIIGNVIGAGLGQAPARQVALAAGLPDSVAAFTVNKVCGSGLKAVMLAAQAIRAGDASVVLAGGIESMSRAPFLVRGLREGVKFGDQQLTDTLVYDGLRCAFEKWHMGCAADYAAQKHGVSRAEQDRFAVQSHQRAATAATAGRFNDEIVPIEIKGRKGSTRVVADECIRADSTVDALARLKPVFGADGSVTAGNASGLSDGAAAVVVASRAVADKLGCKPLARVVAYATSGGAPKELFTAPVAAMRIACEKAGVVMAQIDLIELNEAFAAQMLACLTLLKLDESRVNVNGGAIALGHPIGASGTRVLATLAHELKRRGGRFGLASLCLGGGNAVAMVIESPG